jgi:hypothetical protein
LPATIYKGQGMTLQDVVQDIAKIIPTRNDLCWLISCFKKNLSGFAMLNFSPSSIEAPMKLKLK